MPGDPIVSASFVGLLSEAERFHGAPSRRVEPTRRPFAAFNSDSVKHFTQADADSGKPLA
jgi:hypothetical protein